MKRILFGSLVALGLAVSATPAQANCAFEYGNTRHFSFARTTKVRSMSYSCSPSPFGGFSCNGPTPWNGLAAYGVPGYAAPPPPAAAYPAPGYPAAGYPAAAYPAPAAPVAPAAPPVFQAPPPKPTAGAAPALQHAGYFYYGQPSNTAANYGTGYIYYGPSSFQAPSYWYDN